MTKKELFDQLADYPDDTLLVIASDSEGNSHSELVDFSVGYFNKEDEEYFELDDEEETDEDEINGIPCICFWPN